MNRLYISLTLLIVGGVFGGFYMDGFFSETGFKRPFPTCTLIFSVLSFLIANRIYTDMKDDES